MMTNPDEVDKLYNDSVNISATTHADNLIFLGDISTDHQPGVIGLEGVVRYLAYF